MPYSLGRKYTYKIEKHPRIIFFWIYVPREAFSQSFRALARKGKKLCLYADLQFCKRIRPGPAVFDFRMNL
jgi:hypothetical protein